jgi:hypothetical protein
MEVKDFTSSMFVPLMLTREMFDEPQTVAINTASILNSSLWIEDMSGICFMSDLIKIEIAFDTNINDRKTFDESKEEIFGIVASKPKFIDDNMHNYITDAQNNTMIRSILNCYSSEIISLPKNMKIYDDLLDRAWSYRIVTDKRIYPCVVDGNLMFECV